MATVAVERHMLDDYAAGLQAIDGGLDAAGREQQVLWAADDERGRLHFLQAVGQRTAASHEELVRLRQVEEVVGIRSLGACGAGAGKSRLDGKALVETLGRVLALLGPLAGERGIGPVPMLGMQGDDLERLCETGQTRFLAVVVAAVPLGI